MYGEIMGSCKPCEMYNSELYCQQISRLKQHNWKMHSELIKGRGVLSHQGKVEHDPIL